MRSFDYTRLGNELWDSEVLSYTAQIHECKGRQEVFLYKKPAELERLVEIAKIQSTESSNKIEGIVTTNTRIKQLCEDKTQPRNRDEQEIMGYRDVLNTIHESHDFIYLQPSYILQLHRDLLRYSEKSFGGKFKNCQNYISETREDGTQFTRFVPLAPYETPEAVRMLCESFQQALALQVTDPLILIPIFINDFLCIHPFNDGNGRMSRLLTALLLYQNGYEVGKYISIESKIEKTKSVYYDVLGQSSQRWHEGENDPTPFVKYLLGIILSCYRDFEERVNIVGAKGTAYDAVKKAVENTIGKFTKNMVLERCPGLHPSTVGNILKRLCDEKYIGKYGSGRNTFYARLPKDM